MVLQGTWGRVEYGSGTCEREMTQEVEKSGTNITPAAISQPVNALGNRLFIVDIMVIDGESAKRTHLWILIRNEGRVGGVDDLGLQLNIEK